LKSFITVAKWRIALLAILFVAPFAFLVAYGAYELWMQGWWWWFTWPMLVCLGVAYYLAWRWQAGKKLLRIDEEVPLHWTQRDEQAWQLVQARADAAKKIKSDKLSDVHFYLDTAKEMALELAQFYHPNTTDPVSSLTIPEILAVVELASHDLAEMTQQYLPGGHLLTVRDWRNAKKIADWYQVGSNIVWGVSAIFNPVDTAVRYLATRAGMTTPLQLLQQNLILWFYTAYIHRLGTYLIDLNSGRLRVGAERYRAYRKAAESPPAKQVTPGYPVTEVSTDGQVMLPTVTLTLFGQVKAGKSSLVNSLLGEQMAKTHVLPETQEITRYELKPLDSAEPLHLLDTVGYGHDGPRVDQLRDTEQAAQKSDLLLLVLHAMTPARQADVDVVQKLHAWFEKLPALKMPPILAVVTHIDLLPPQLEWSPPYHWEKPKRAKEKRIAELLDFIHEQFGSRIAGAIPVCVAEGKVYGVQEWLLPTIIRLLGESRATSMLRCLHNEADAGKIRKVVDQLLAASGAVLKGLWEQMK
jgi:predicted GTPase